MNTFSHILISLRDSILKYCKAIIAATKTFRRFRYLTSFAVSHQLFSGLVFLMLISCKSEVILNNNPDNQLVLLAEITAGDSAFIPVAASMDAGSGSPIVFEKVTNGVVTITPASTASYRLRYNRSASAADKRTAIYTHPVVFRENQAYKITVTHPALGTASAVAKIPGPFTVSEMKKEEAEIYGRDAVKVSFEIEDDPQEENYYLIEAVKQMVRLRKYFEWQGVRHDYSTPAGKELHEKIENEYDIDLPVRKDTAVSINLARLNIFTADAMAENSSIGSLDSNFRRILFTDDVFTGQTYHTVITIPEDRFEARNTQEKGVVYLRIKSVDKALYQYLTEYEKYKTDFGKMPAGQLGSPRGNIENGLGVFGGSFKREWVLYYDELD